MTNSRKKSGLGDSPLFQREKKVEDRYQKQTVTKPPELSKQHPQPTPNSTSKVTLESTRITTPARDKLRDNPRTLSRQADVPYPNRNEIQTFSFQLRDAWKVKVQAEVPHEWQKELEEIAHTLNIKKMELYRFIFGEFLGKVKRKE